MIERKRTRAVTPTKRDVLNTIKRRYPHYDPILAMVTLAHQPEVAEDYNLQLACHKEVARYCVPQLKAVELTGDGGAPLKTRVEVAFVRPAQIVEDEELEVEEQQALPGVSTQVIDIADQA